ncbi:MAG: hypothetical protein Tsb004_10080 [Allomuricauda sp.]
MSFRFRGTTVSGGSFNEDLINLVWQKAYPVIGYDSNVYRKDRCGAWIKRSEYGNTLSQYGWEIDHDLPVSRGGKDELNNLQPLQWENNRHKSDNYPKWFCKIG